MEEYDVLIIGAGPGGYTAALRAAQKGLKTAVVEKDHLGGVCLNWGCIPTKVLLETAKHLNSIKSSEEFGIKVTDFQVDPLRIWQRKNRVVEGLRRGIEYLFKARGVNFINGKARLVDKNTVEVISDSATTQLKAKNIIIATGSLPFELPNVKFNHKNVLSSDDILELNYIPKSLVIVGGGVIGCEFASFFSSLGTNITIVELLDSLLPQEDREISKMLETYFKKKGVIVKTKTGLESVILENGLKVSLSDGTKINTELILICVGRKPNSANLGLERENIVTGDKGWIATDDYLRTNCKNIYAIGDVTGKILLAHMATRQAEIAVGNILGQDRAINYSVVPNCIFTFPEIASVGLNENKAKELGIDYGTGKFPFRALGKANVTGEVEGFLKLLIDKKNEEVLGAHIIGPEATELITTLTLAIENKLKAGDIADTIYAHPTFSEIIPESIFAFFKKPLHTV